MEKILAAFDGLDLEKIRHGADVAGLALRNAAKGNVIVNRLADVLDDFAAAGEEERSRIIRKVVAAGLLCAADFAATFEPTPSIPAPIPRRRAGDAG